MRLETDPLEVERCMARSGCRERRCALTVTLDLYRMVYRVLHNGVRFSYATDIEASCARRAGDDAIERLLELWCREHHADRSGYEIMLRSDDGSSSVVIMPEAEG